MKPKLANIGGEQLMEVPNLKSLGALIRADYDKWIKIIKGSGISLD